MLKKLFPNSNIDLIKQINDLEQAKNIQKKYSRLLRKASYKQFRVKSWQSINTIAGVDISYYKRKNSEFGIGCAVLWDFKKNLFIEVQFNSDKITFPYIPGYLAFREVPLIVKTLKMLSRPPDIIMCDGHGIIHPKNFGVATHLGFSLGVPSIGIAKNPFIGKSNWKSLKRLKSEKTPVFFKKEIVGYAICLSDDRKPVFVSEGHKIDINLAIEVSLKLTKTHRQPEPLYLADNLSRKQISKL